MPRSRIAYAFLGSFVLMVFLLQWWQQPSYPSPVWWTLAFIGGIGLIRTRTLLLPAALGCLCALLAVAHATQVYRRDGLVPTARNQVVTLQGWIADLPDIRAGKASYVVETLALNGSPVHGRVLVSDDGWPRHAYGDEVTVRGNLERPSDIDGFRYDLYLRLRTIGTVIARARIAPAGPVHGSSALRMLYAWRGALDERLSRLDGEPQASLLAGLLLGSRQGLPQSVQDDFRRSGVTHLVAISGSNIALLVSTVSVLLFWLPRRWRLFPAAVLIVGFTLLVGAGASVVRAAVMGILALLAAHLGRTTQARLTLLWTAFLMLLWNPLQLWYDAGFQLSFLAVIGLLEAGPRLEPLCRWAPEALGLREGLRLSLAAELLTAPWSLFAFHQVSFVAPLANLLAPPVVPLAMLSGFAGLLASWVSPVLGIAFTLPAHLCLTWILAVTHVLAGLPGAAAQDQAVGAVTVTLAYAVIALWVVRSPSHQT
jgi:competence protein ComEC